MDGLGEPGRPEVPRLELGQAEAAERARQDREELARPHRLHQVGGEAGGEAGHLAGPGERQEDQGDVPLGRIGLDRLGQPCGVASGSWGSTRAKEKVVPAARGRP